MTNKKYYTNCCGSESQPLSFDMTGYCPECKMGCEFVDSFCKHENVSEPTTVHSGFGEWKIQVVICEDCGERVNPKNRK